MFVYVPAWVLARDLKQMGSQGAAVTPFIFGSLGAAFFADYRRAMLILAGIDGGILVVAAMLLMASPVRAVTADADLAPPTASAVPDYPTKEDPAVVTSDITLIPAVDGKGDTPEKPATLCEVVHGRRFQLLCVMGFFFGSGAWINVVHIVSMALDGGLSKTNSENLLTFLAYGSISFRIPAGLLADRIGRLMTLILMLTIYAAFSAASALSALEGELAYMRCFTVIIGGLTGSILTGTWVFHTFHCMPLHLFPLTFNNSF
jgi:MFS family permease